MKSDRNNPMFMPYPNVNMQGMYPIMPGVNELENRIITVYNPDRFGTEGEK